MNEIKDNYTPFGEEWEKEVSKMPKKYIIDLFRQQCILRQKYQAAAETNYEQVIHLGTLATDQEAEIAALRERVKKLEDALRDILEWVDPIDDRWNYMAAIEKAKQLLKQ